MSSMDGRGVKIIGVAHDISVVASVITSDGGSDTWSGATHVLYLLWCS
jgi:hypothetical protein